MDVNCSALEIKRVYGNFGNHSWVQKCSCKLRATGWLGAAGNQDLLYAGDPPHLKKNTHLKLRAPLSQSIRKWVFPHRYEKRKTRFKCSCKYFLWGLSRVCALYSTTDANSEFELSVLRGAVMDKQIRATQRNNQCSLRVIIHVDSPLSFFTSFSFFLSSSSVPSPHSRFNFYQEAPVTIVSRVSHDKSAETSCGYIAPLLLR